MINRQEYLDTLINLKDKNVIKVVTGIRRCGKSTLFEIFQNYLNQSGVNSNNIISINFEDGEYRNIKSPEMLYDFVEEKLDKENMNYLFLDEIQNLKKFEKAVDWLYLKKNVDLYVTGSNAFLLSSELATLLSGRYIEIKMLPLSFKEYASAFENNNINLLYNKYLQNSSFPGAVEFNRQKDIKDYLEGIYNSILVKDVLTRMKIAESSMLQSIIEYRFDNIGNISSSNKIANTMTSLGRKISVSTVENYLQSLTASFILYKVGRYDIKGKQHLATLHKYYVADIGLRYYLLGTKAVDMGHILENIVFLELIRRGYDVKIGKIGDAEVDFVATNELGIEYYQVALTVLDKNTLERELKSLDSINDHNPKYLLTMDYTPLTSHNGIKQINVLDWLLK